MNQRNVVTIDGNEAASRIAHKLNEVIAIYPLADAERLLHLAQADVRERWNTYERLRRKAEYHHARFVDYLSWPHARQPAGAVGLASLAQPR